MSYLDSVATAIQRELGESSRDATPAALLRFYAVLLLAKGTKVTAEDVHNAWSAWMQETQPGHPAIRPYDELDDETKAADMPFVEAIQRAAATMRNADS